MSPEEPLGSNLQDLLEQRKEHTNPKDCPGLEGCFAFPDTAAGREPAVRAWKLVFHWVLPSSARASGQLELQSSFGGGWWVVNVGVLAGGEWRMEGQRKDSAVTLYIHRKGGQALCRPSIGCLHAPSHP